MQRHYEQNFQTYDLFLSLLSTAVIAIVLDKYWGRDQILQLLAVNRTGIYTSIAQISGSLLGFIIATVTIILGIGEIPGMEILRTSKHFGTLFSVYFNAIRVLALTTVWALVSLVFDTQSDPKPIMTCVVLWTVILSIRYVQRCVWILKRLIMLAIKAPSGKVTHGVQ